MHVMQTFCMLVLDAFELIQALQFILVCHPLLDFKLGAFDTQIWSASFVASGVGSA